MSNAEARVRARLHTFADSIIPLTDVRANGRARYRRRVRRQRAAAVLAGVLVVVGTSGLGVELARGSGRAHSVQVGTRGGSSSIGTSAARPTAAVVGLSRRIADTTWISDDTGWALTGSAILRTTDGGRTWAYVAAKPRTPARYGSPCGSVCVTRIRFADARHGWLFGNDFFQTDDGGKTWTRVLSDPVVALEVAHGRAYRLVSEGGGCPGPCDYELQTESVGGGPWLLVRTPDIGPSTDAQLLYDGPRLYIATYGSAMNPTLSLLRSLDGGASWQRRPDPCTAGTDDLPVQLATAPGGFVVALCRHNAGGTYVRTSSDGATTFGAARSLPPNFSNAGSGGVAIAAGAASTLLVVGTDGHATHVTVSHDLGVIWSETLTPAEDARNGVTFIGFEDSRTGRVAITGDRLWTTRDGGDTWTVGRP